MAHNSQRPSLLADSVRAHMMRFEAPLAPTYRDAVGIRILVAFLGVGIGVFLALRFALGAAGVRGLPVAHLAFVLTLMVAFIAAQRLFVQAPFADVGLRPFADWTRRERLIFLQTVPLVSVACAFIFRDRLLALAEQHGIAGFVFFSVLTGLVWGMVQEFFYRGWLQTELTRRFGALAGLLAANVAFTFGPLHFNYLSGSDGVRWSGLAAVFGVGLMFGFLYRRSGNLWFPAVLHGLWPLNMA